MIRPRSWWRLVGLAAFGLALSACHSYVPVERPAPGTTVRVRVPVVTALSNPNAPPETVAIEGDVLSTGDTLVLATETRREFGAFRQLVQFDTLRLAPDQRTSVELREFSSGKSVLLGLAIAGGAVAFAAAAFGFGGGGDGGTPDPTPPTPAVVVSGSFLSAVWGLFGH